MKEFGNEIKHAELFVSKDPVAWYLKYKVVRRPRAYLLSSFRTQRVEAGTEVCVPMEQCLGPSPQRYPECGDVLNNPPVYLYHLSDGENAIMWSEGGKVKFHAARHSI